MSDSFVVGQLIVRGRIFEYSSIRLEHRFWPGFWPDWWLPIGMFTEVAPSGG